MKHKIFICLLTLFLSLISYALLSIGKATVNGNNTLLDFDDSPTNTKGIILPAVTSEDDVNLTNGTFIFDVEDDVVKMYENGIWVDLSDESEGGNDQQIDINSANDIGGGTIIGDSESTAEGVLVLESPNKAMVLPKIANPHSTVKSPYPGMMCYDTVSKSLAVFDGSKWYYWK